MKIELQILVKQEELDEVIDTMLEIWTGIGRSIEDAPKEFIKEVLFALDLFDPSKPEGK